MKRALTYITLFDMIFILLLSLSASFGRVLYYLAFTVPVLLFIAIRKSVAAEPLKIKPTGESIALTLPTVAPTVALVFAVSYLTSLLLSLVGADSSPDVSGSLVYVIFKHAIVTAVLEEALFRYLPLALLTPHTRRGAVLISALMFSLAHCNLYQIPYAFIAGAIFALLDVSLSSVWPSLIIHLINNVASVFWLRYGDCKDFVITYIGILAFFAIISIVIILKYKDKYKKLFSSVISDGRKYKLSYEPVLFAAATVTVAIFNLF